MKNLIKRVIVIITVILGFNLNAQNGTTENVVHGAQYNKGYSGQISEKVFNKIHEEGEYNISLKGNNYSISVYTDGYQNQMQIKFDENQRAAWNMNWLDLKPADKIWWENNTDQGWYQKGNYMYHKIVQLDDCGNRGTVRYPIKNEIKDTISNNNYVITTTTPQQQTPVVEENNFSTNKCINYRKIWNDVQTQYDNVSNTSWYVISGKARKHANFIFKKIKREAGACVADLKPRWKNLGIKTVGIAAVGYGSYKIGQNNSRKKSKTTTVYHTPSGKNLVVTHARNNPSMIRIIKKRN